MLDTLPAAAPRPSRLEFAVLSLHALLSPLVLWTLSDDAFEPPKVALLQTAALVLVGISASACIARIASGPAWALPRLPRDLAGWGALAVLASASLSTLTSASPTTSLFGAARSHLGLFSIAAFIVLFLATRRCAGNPVYARGLVAASLLGAAGASAYAVVQLAALDPIAWKPTWDATARPFGSLGQPNFLGAYLASVWSLAAWASLAAARAEHSLCAVLLASLAALFAGLCVLCLSRGAWLALAAAGAVLTAGWWLAGERRGAAALVAAAIAALIAAAGLRLFDTSISQDLLREGVGWRLASLAAIRAEPRWHLWDAAWWMFLDHPLIGAGLDCFVVEFDRYRTPAYWLTEWNAGPTRAHVSLLQIAATQGAVGLGAYGLLLAGLATAARRAFTAAAGPTARAFVVALVAGLVAFVAQGLFSFTFVALGALAVMQAALLAPTHPVRLEKSPAAGAGVRALQALTWGLIALAWLRLIGAPLYAEALRAEGQQLTAAGYPELGAERLERAVALDGSREAQWVDLGLAHYIAALGAPDTQARRTRLARARLAQERARALTPNRAYAHSNLARTLLEQAALDPPEATQRAVRDAYDRALALDAANVFILRDAIHASFARGDLERARRLAAHSVELYPRYAPAHLYLGLAMLRAGDWDAAARSLEAARGSDWLVDQADGPTRARTALAAARLAQNQLDDAARLAQESVQANPANPVAWTYLGAAHELRGEALRKRVREAGSDTERGAWGAQLRAHHGAALDAYRRAAEIDPTNPVARIGVERLGAESAGE